MLLACSSPERTLNYSRHPRHPSVPFDDKLLKTGLNAPLDPKIFGKSGSLWRIDVINLSDDQVRVHWLVLYPDGKCIISLRGWREEWDNNPTDLGLTIRNEIFKRHQQIVINQDQAALQQSYQDLVGDGYYRAPLVGRFAASENKLEINVLERDPQEHGGIGFGRTSEGVAVSRLTFLRNGDTWALDQKLSYTVWHPDESMTENILGLNIDRPALRSVRQKNVTLRKIEGLVPPPLPTGWEW